MCVCCVTCACVCVCVNLPAYLGCIVAITAYVLTGNAGDRISLPFKS